MSKTKTKAKKAAVSAISHQNGRCGNPGCTRCFGVNFKGFLSKGKPYKMPQWMWIRWMALSEDERKKIAKK